MIDGGLIGYDSGLHCWTTSVVTTGRSGSPVMAPAWSLQACMFATLLRNRAEVPTSAKSWVQALMTAFCASLSESFESMKSTTSLRPAMPPCALMYLAKPWTPATEPANRPGSTGTSTSATTAIRIVVGVTPTSVALSAPPPLDWAPALLMPSPAASMPTTAAIATHRPIFIQFPPSSPLLRARAWHGSARLSQRARPAAGRVASAAVGARARRRARRGSAPPRARGSPPRRRGRR